MRSKAITIVALIFGSLLLSATPSNAAVNIGCLLNSPKVITSKTIESYSVWLKRQKLEQNNSACFTDEKALKAAYNTLAKKVTLDLQSTDKNDFNKRYDACTKGSGITLNPASWFTSLKCLFTTSFFPTSDVLKVKFGELLGDFKSHQPTSYIPIALGVITNLKDNWGGTSCATGSIKATVKVPSMSNNWEFVIPCKPPTALAALRSLMVLSVWLGFAFWLYRTGIGFWKERAA